MIYFSNKPHGLPTHRPSPDRLGFIEYLNNNSETLHICHRLDKETSGAMVFAKSKMAAAELSKLFEKREIKKRYLLVTDRKNNLPEEVTVRSNITKKKNVFISKKSENPNSESHFRRIKQNDCFSLWEVIPKTGKTHQIRLHAQQLGINILGDKLYNGSNFPRLMLHSMEIALKYQNEDYSHKVEAPKLFQDLNLLKDATMSSWLAAYDRRKTLYDLDSKTNNCYRLLHDEDPKLRIDKLDEKLWFYWYQDSAPNISELKRIEKFCKIIDCSKWKIQLMKNRGSKPLPETNLSNIEAKSWTAQENEINYIFKTSQGYSPGLFLDQRNNRKWVKDNSKNKSILNLFCYTAGFSVCAAIGGANKVISVDTSKATLNWAKENFTANNLNFEDYEFWSSDARLFIKGAVKRNQKFDIIICDPPSFARNKDGVFKIEKDIGSLLSGLAKLLNTSGTILFSTNYEGWTQEDLEERISRLSELQLADIQIQVSLDYELPGEERLMKSVFLRKN